ncbi:hypothetical protein AX16_006904 [Volvariella volvacea WC 439]|nr:hypothetical protein AX16_006904 [Volvariella volvacea WC 439]
MEFPQYESPLLKEVPEMLEEDMLEFESNNTMNDPPNLVMLYEKLNKTYDHPFFTARLAELFYSMDALLLSVVYCRRAKDTLDEMGDSDHVLHEIFIKRFIEAEELVNEGLQRARLVQPYQTWKPSFRHEYPCRLPYPSEHEEIISQWRSLKSDERDRYLTSLAIETNQIESIFLLTEESTQDLVQRGVARGSIETLPGSDTHDPAKIRRIINDTITALGSVREIIENNEKLSKEVLCRIHAQFMYTCRFVEHDDPTGPITYIAAGETRTITRQSVVVAGEQIIQCCPPSEVDKEVEYICRKANELLAHDFNPFAAASWIHLILVRCHPFEDGNGRLSRLIASIPLMMHGYPPIAIMFSERKNYYDAVNSAHEDDHSLFIDCVTKGMVDTMNAAQESSSRVGRR